VIALLIVGLLAPAATDALAAAPDEATTLQRGTIERPAAGTTVISVQGFNFAGSGNEKKPSRVVGVGPRGEVEWVHTGVDVGGGDRPTWFYDVDPTPNDTVRIVSIVGDGRTLVYEWDPVADEVLWRQRLDDVDSHDVDVINGDQLLVAEMRAANETTGEANDGISVYDMGRDEVV
jgi:hypothetical protein